MMEKHPHHQQVLTFDVGRTKKLTDQERRQVVEALADVLRAALRAQADRETTHEE